MRKCIVCGTECASDLVRCTCCQSLLPSTEIDSPIIPCDKKLVKICSCGQVNNKNSVRCEKCGGFLDDAPLTVAREDGLALKKKRISIKVSSGEIIPIERELIIGREYQNDLWDCYSHRAAYRVHCEPGCIMIDDLTNKTTSPISFNKEYEMGRKVFKFIEGE